MPLINNIPPFGFEPLPKTTPSKQKTKEALHKHNGLEDFHFAIKPENQETPTNQALTKKSWRECETPTSDGPAAAVKRACLAHADAKEIITIRCSDEPISIDACYKEGLARDSSFFRTLFSTQMKEKEEGLKLPNIKASELRDLLAVWRNDLEPDAQQAYDLLEASHQLDLALPRFIATLVREVKTWTVAKREDVQTAASLMEQIQLVDFGDLRDALTGFLIDSYFGHGHTKDHLKEIRPLCLLGLKTSNIETLELRAKFVNDEGLKELLESCPQISSLCVAHGAITDKSVETIHLLKNLKHLNLFGCPLLSTAAMENLAQLTEVTTLHPDEYVYSEPKTIPLCPKTTDMLTRVTELLKRDKNVTIIPNPNNPNFPAIISSIVGVTAEEKARKKLVIYGITSLVLQTFTLQTLILQTFLAAENPPTHHTDRKYPDVVDVD